MIYLDANATTPLAGEVLDAMLPWLKEGFCNPNASYTPAKQARKAIEHARGQVATLIGAQPEEIVFTSGGTEGNNAALKWLARLIGRKNGTVITSAIEHSAVLRPIETFEKVGYAVTRCGVDGHGRLNLSEYETACRAAAEKGGGFSSIMWANNETGVIQPIQQACEIAKAHGLPFHTDAVQALGKIPVNVRTVPVDFLTLSAHKFHGPKGVGALYIRSGCAFEPLLRGGGQENDRRSGTENTAGIVGLGMAAELAMNHLYEPTLRDEFERLILEQISGAEISGRPADRLPNTSHISFSGCEAAALLILLDDAGLYCSAGSACMTGKQQPSHVQMAMGYSDKRAKSSLRFGLHRYTSAEDIPLAVEKLKKAVEKVRQVQSRGTTGPVSVYTP
jgi:cysteine desulfurase